MCDAKSLLDLYARNIGYVAAWFQQRWPTESLRYTQQGVETAARFMRQYEKGAAEFRRAARRA